MNTRSCAACARNATPDAAETHHPTSPESAPESQPVFRPVSATEITSRPETESPRLSATDSGASSTITCAFVPLIPNADTP
ncbi:hypothetical protein, partial [Streptomyces finlayi]|uniref:hypothetical protein n=1 Tax=Streptomyces finlayi TaxID=67296 RepID=UPI001E3A3B3D